MFIVSVIIKKPWFEVKDTVSVIFDRGLGAANQRKRSCTLVVGDISTASSGENFTHALTALKMEDLKIESEEGKSDICGLQPRRLENETDAEKLLRSDLHMVLWRGRVGFHLSN